MSKIKPYIKLIIFVIVISSIVYILRHDAISIAIKDSDGYVATDTEIVWYKFFPHWAITLEKDGRKRTLIVDGFSRQVIAEPGCC
jgi:hypothetical protein